MLGSRLLCADGPLGESAAEVRHRTLTEFKRTAQQHPAVDSAAGVRADDGRYRELEVVFDPLILDTDADQATLRIDWRPRPEPGDAAYFVCHYFDSAGRDFGWHREPNPHVDGLEHVQERSDPDGAYEYEPAAFESLSPIPLLWDIFGRLERRV